MPVRSSLLALQNLDLFSACMARLVYYRWTTKVTFDMQSDHGQLCPAFIPARVQPRVIIDPSAKRHFAGGPTAAPFYMITVMLEYI